MASYFLKQCLRYRKANHFLDAAKLLIKVRPIASCGEEGYVRVRGCAGGQGRHPSRARSSQGQEDVRAGSCHGVLIAFLPVGHMLAGLGLLTCTLCDTVSVLQVDKHVAHSRQKVAKVDVSSAGSSRQGGEFSNTLQELLSEDYSSVFESSLLSNPWRPVEAYHFFLLAQTLFYTGHFEDSLKTVSFVGKTSHCVT